MCYVMAVKLWYGAVWSGEIRWLSSVEADADWLGLMLHGAVSKLSWVM